MYYFIGFFDESEQDVGFADCGVADDDYFGKVVVLLLFEGLWSLPLKHNLPNNV